MRDPYLYENVPVLKNELNIKDAKLLERAEADITHVVFTADDQIISFEAQLTPNSIDETLNDVSWVLADEPDILLRQPAVKDMIRPLYSLSVASSLSERMENPNPQDFGFLPESASATAFFNDGSTTTIRIGHETPARDQYYLMLDGDPEIYLIQNFVWRRFFNSYDNFIDKTLFTPEALEQLEYLRISERGKLEIEFGFVGTEDEREEMLESFGMIFMTMIKPYPDRDLYYSNLWDGALSDFQFFSLTELVDMFPSDLSQYGLDDPLLEIQYYDYFRVNETHLIFGDQTEDGMVYCMVVGRPHVFTTRYDNITPLIGLNPFRFIDRFVLIRDIYTCLSIDIIAPGREHEIRLDQYTVPVVSDFRDGEDNEFDAFVDGQFVQKRAFQTFYQNLIGITYDGDVGDFIPEDEPELIIKFEFSDLGEIEVRYYVYDANFYAVQYGDLPITNVTNKQWIDNMLESIDDLKAGRLDRD